jgi:hypothetical protein
MVDLSPGAHAKNKYSVAARAVGRAVEIQAYANRMIIIRQGGAIVGEHVRCSGRNQTLYHPWHYIPVLYSFGALADLSRREAEAVEHWLGPAAAG